MPDRRIKVLVVEEASDSCSVRQVLAKDPEIELVGTTTKATETLEMVQRRKPDVVTVDINLSRTSAFELTRCIMQFCPVPVIVVSASWKPEEVATTFDALEAGAVAVAGKPKLPAGTNSEEEARKLVRTVKAMSEVKVVRRWSRSRMQMEPAVPVTPTRISPAEIRVVAIGASTGGPLSIQILLSALPADFPVPILIVQHIAPGFVKGFADWLGHSTRFSVAVAEHGQTALAGRAYLAPDGLQMGISNEGRITITPPALDNGLRPSISHLFASVAKSYGARAAGVLLSGMGRDGAEELKLMKQKGALTIVQDRESSVVYGMPGEAIALNAASYVLNPEGIAALLDFTLKQQGASQAMVMKSTGEFA